MEAIVLAGGFGTRLRHIVSDVPKPMAQVCGRPFLQYILEDLAKKGVCRVILAVGYKQEVIKDFFGDSYAGMEVAYSVEEAPLLTGGAVKQAMASCTREQVLIVNGDTYFDVDIEAMARQHRNTGAELTIATKRMRHFDRYGTVKTDETGRILEFKEKAACEQGDINGGVYMVQRNAILALPQAVFSFETEYMEKQVGTGRIYAFTSEGYFIDIGVPEDYVKAQEDFATHA